MPETALARPVATDWGENALAETAVARLRALGADYGDVRLGRDLERYLVVADDNVDTHSLKDSSGIGVRALVRGFWGFCATPDLTPEGVTRAVERAVAMARGVAAVTPADRGLPRGALAEEPPHRAEVHTPVEVCPFTLSTAELAAPLIAAAQAALGLPGVKRVRADLPVHGHRRLFASTDGALILRTHVVIDAQQRFYAVDNGTSAYRTLLATGKAAGFEHVLGFDFPGKAKGAAADALAKCRAAKPAPGRYDLILDPHNLALTMHESVGHPTELDRVLGFELGFAGGSFASTDKLGHFRYGSPLVNFTADNTFAGGNATIGFDDEGVVCSKFPIIRDGVLVGYGTSRETAHVVGAPRANGTCRATSWYDAPIVRIPNLYLEPGKQRLALAELIADTRQGILMLGRDSFSIDQMRYNFQFGSDMAYRIEDGRVVEPLRDVIYQAITPEFWGACDAICDEREWQAHGVVNCGKGQPTQAGKMLHGAAPARFRQIRVGY